MKNILAFVALFTMAPFVLAEPVVIFDSGVTMPSYPYKQLFSGKNVPDFGKDWALEKIQKLGDGDKSNDVTDPDNWLPITTAKLSPGDVTARTVQFNQLASPVCIIGSDERSIEWVTKYQPILLKYNALCWLVEANGLSDVQRVVTALNGVSMSPADGDAIAEFFDLSHYPAFITQRFIEQ